MDFRHFCCVILFSFLNTFTDPYNIVIASIPKAGTHLVADCVKHITKRDLVYGFPILGIEDLNEAVIKKANFSSFFVTHLPYHQEYDRMLKNSRFRGILVCRDPRDQLVSLLEWIYQHPESWPAAQRMSRNELLSKLIYCKDYEKFGLPTEGVLAYYNQFLYWRSSADFYMVKFEDLVGPLARDPNIEKSEKRRIKNNQAKVISQIAKHIGSPLTTKEAERIGDNLFGKSTTFRKGKIGNWKKYFTSKHKAEFKKYANKLLVDLGYEKKGSRWW